MDIGISSIIVASITGISSIITAIIWGYVPRKRNEEIKRLQKELIEVYGGVYNLKIVEEKLENELGISKAEARKGINIPKSFETKRLEKRTLELQSKLD
nr:hypothetical protein [uncultured Prevotella sp.]